MKILSFLDCVSRLSLRALLVYNRLKYKNFAKLIGKTLKDTLKFLATLLSKKPELAAGSPSSSSAATTFTAHYNNFLTRIFTTVIYSPRLASIRWTVLSQLLNTRHSGQLTLATKWLVLSIMCGIDAFHEQFYDTFVRDRQHYERLRTAGSGGYHKMTGRSPKDYILQACETELEAMLTNENTELVNASNSNVDIELLSFIRTVHFLIDLEGTSKTTGTISIKIRKKTHTVG
jgi:hypothetical protein